MFILGIMRQSEMLITTISDMIDIYGMTPNRRPIFSG